MDRYDRKNLEYGLQQLVDNEYERTRFYHAMATYRGRTERDLLNCITSACDYLPSSEKQAYLNDLSAMSKRCRSNKMKRRIRQVRQAIYNDPPNPNGSFRRRRRFGGLARALILLFLLGAIF
ncbi:MAG: hypothetical protein AAGU27_06225 [Dehalobacterium sp.]